LAVWGYILLGPGRPPLQKQRDFLRIAGVKVDGAHPPVWLDKIEGGAKGPGSGRRQLDERNGLLLASQEGDKVVAATPYCLGLSEGDVRWFIDELRVRKISLVVSSAAKQVTPEADAKELLAEVAREQNTANVAAYRSRKSQAKVMRTRAERPIEGETWRDIPGYPGYQVSNLGRVRSLDRVIQAQRRNGIKNVTLKGRLLKPRPLPNGYLRASLGAGSDEYIHRLVLLAFVGECPPGMECAHDDGNRANNRLANLAWKTPTANNADKRRHGTVMIGDKNPAWAGPFCQNGHEYTPENTRLQKRGKATIRICRACVRERMRRTRAELKQQST
jgi:hypothetical protein